MLSVFLTNRPLPQRIFTTYVPLFWRLDPVTLTNGELNTVLWVTAAVFIICLVPLFKPRPRRILNIVSLSQQRIIVAGAILATLGYFNWSHRLPRATLVMTCTVLLVMLPAWFVLIRRRPNVDDSRSIIVGDDTEGMEAVLSATEIAVIGYVSPLSHSVVQDSEVSGAYIADGGSVLDKPTEEQGLGDLERLGGLSRLDEVLVEYDIDTALLAFASPDRAEFFGTLDACYEHGVIAKVHREHADSVLTTGFGRKELVDVDLKPWDTLDQIGKRAFDIIFSLLGLVAFLPVIFIIVIAIKLEDGGPVLYNQERTAAFGDTFTVYKFRSMVEEAESITGARISEEDEGGVDPRVTQVGRILRQTHLDEIPQLLSILMGEMSVVGPRPERPELEVDFESNRFEWRRRWFVKPGLTGLAQINDVTGHQPEEKLRLDIEYIRRQSFWFDVKIVLRQIWQILSASS